MEARVHMEHLNADDSIVPDTSSSSFTMPIGAVIGIAIVGAVILLGTLVVFGIWIARRRNRQKLNYEAKEQESQPVHKEVPLDIQGPCLPQPVLYAIRSQRTPPLNHTVSNDWVDENGLHGPRLSKPKPKRYSLFRSSIRDSWPLNSKRSSTPLIPMALRASQQPLEPNIPPQSRYIDEETQPSWPTRTSSKTSRSQPLVYDKSNHSPDPPADVTDQEEKGKLPAERRSKSELQLSSILRSTSFRLRHYRNQSAPKSKLTGVREADTESQKKLFEDPNTLPDIRDESSNQEGGSIASIYESYMNRTPSPHKAFSYSNSHMVDNGKLQQSSSLSILSDDTFCGHDSPSRNAQASLSSPDKSGRRESQGHKMEVSLGGLGDFSVVLESRASVVELNTRDSTGEPVIINVRGSRSPSLRNDPFTSSSKIKKQSFSRSPLNGPRPMTNQRNATFGEQHNISRSTNSPIHGKGQSSSTSGNTRISRPSTAESDNGSPFQWSPTKAIQNRAKVNRGGKSSSVDKTHKGAHISRLSTLSRASSVGGLTEVSEEGSTLSPSASIYDFTADWVDPVQLRSPSRAGSIKSSSRPASRQHLRPPSRPISRPFQRPTSRPPSVSVFNPPKDLVYSEILEESNVPIPGITESRPQSPALSLGYYYTQHLESKDDLFVSKSALQSRRNSYSEPSPDDDPRTVFVFPPLPNLIKENNQENTPPTQILSRLPSSGSPAPMPLRYSSRGSTLFNMPSQLVGPQAEPPKTLPPSPKGNLGTSIAMLRRMNSQVSLYSSVSMISTADRGSPSIADMRGGGSSPTKLGRDKHRGSEYYLNLGSSPTKESSKEIDRRRFAWQQPNKNYSLGMYNSSIIDTAEAIYEDSAESTGTSRRLSILALDFPFPQTPELQEGEKEEKQPQIISRPSTPPSQTRRDSKVTTPNSTERSLFGPLRQKRGSEVSTSRWSAVMAKPTHSSVRRVSKLEHPIPRTPPEPKWISAAPNEQENRSWGQTSSFSQSNLEMYSNSPEKGPAADI